MSLDLTNVRMDVVVETLSLDRNAFYNLCFITENDNSPRTIIVETLGELLSQGYTRDSLAYNFCVGVFAQKGIPNITIRAKRSSESYEEAFSSDSNDHYYFTVIESKDLDVVKSFNDHLNSSDEYKLQFYSSNEEAIDGRKLVHYFHNLEIPFDNSGDFYINKAYGLPSNSPLETVATAQKSRLAYPEGAWIADCGDSFPSRIQWLYKNLVKVDIHKEREIPDFSTTSAKVFKTISTIGSGTTTQGIEIHNQVSLDWLKWALGRSVWKTLYGSSKINATEAGSVIITNTVKDVLELAVLESIITSYNITEVVLMPRDNNISVKFNAIIMQTIMNLEIEGTVHH